METIATNGIRLQVLKVGPENGPVALMLHGFPEGSYAWEDLARRLAATGYRVWVPDQRGYNGSDKPPRVSDYNAEVIARDVLGLIDATGQRQVDVIGHDWGGYVAWWAAARHPERIRRLVVLNCAHPNVMFRNVFLNPRQTMKSWYVFAIQWPGVPEWLLRRNGYRNLLKQIVRAGGKPVPAAEAQQYIAAWSRPRALTSMLNWYRATIQSFPLRLDNPRIHVPALLIWGQLDRFLESSMAHPSIEYCDQGRVAYLPRASHWLHHEQPDDVVRLIHEFLGSTSGS